jgi:hypothetical protein
MIAWNLHASSGGRQFLCWQDPSHNQTALEGVPHCGVNHKVSCAQPQANKYPSESAKDEDKTGAERKLEYGLIEFKADEPDRA